MTLSLATGVFMGSRGRSGGGVPGASALIFSANLLNNLEDTAGQLFPAAFNTETTDGVMSVTDHEGAVKICRANEARYTGARRVENRLPHSRDSDFWTQSAGAFWDKSYGSDSDGDYVQWTCNLASTFKIHNYINGVPIGHRVTNRYKIKSSVDITGFRLMTGGTFSEHLSLNLTANTLHDLCVVTGKGVTSGGGAGVWRNTAAAIGDWFRIYEVQNEDVTGQSSYLPSEFVSVGVGTGDEEILNLSAPDWAFTNGSSDGTTITLNSGLAIASSTNFASTREDVLYAVTYTRGGASTDAAAPTCSGTALTSRSAAGTYTEVVRGGSVGVLFGIGATFTNTITFSDISIKEIDHGSNVDGVKYFLTDNGTVHNLPDVTDAAGSPITPKGFRVDESSTNLILDSTPDSAQASWTLTGGSEALLNDFIGEIALTRYTFATSDVIETAITTPGASQDVALSFYFQRGTYTGNMSVDAIGAGAGSWTVDCGHASLATGTHRLSPGHPAVTVTTDFASGVGSTLGISWVLDAPTGSQTFLIGGIQAEQRNDYETSYIPTAGATVSRAVTQLLYDFQPPTKLGSMIATVNVWNAPNAGTSDMISNNTSSRFVYMLAGGAMYSWDGTFGVGYANPNVGYFAQHSLGIVYEDGAQTEKRVFRDGGLGSTAGLDAGWNPGVDWLGIGCLGSTFLNTTSGDYKNINFYDIRLSDEDMQTLTT